VRSSRSQDTTRPAPRLRRAYYDCRYGQLHLHNAIPSGGGFDELTPVICVHGAGQNARVFAPVLLPLGMQRSVYALDLPGCGETDPAPGVDSVEAGANAVNDFVTSMRIRSFDLVARNEGCAIALRVLEHSGQAVRRMVLAGADSVRPASKVTLLSLAEADAPAFGAQLLALLDARH
jgi:pimeloyl-ACP methyl ester carboxylesterase